MAKIGKPRKFKSVEHLESLINAYMKDCDEREMPYTIEGLAVACDCDRKTILNYAHKDDYFPTISKYRNIILARLSELGISGKGNASSIIFNLKNNYGYADKQEIQTTNSHQVQYYAPQKNKDN